MDRTTLQRFRARHRLWFFALGWCIRWARLFGGYEAHGRQSMTQEPPAYICDLCARPAPKRRYVTREWDRSVHQRLVYRFCSLQCLEDWETMEADDKDREPDRGE